MIKEYINKYKEDARKCVEDLKSIKTWYKQIPNLLTISRPIGMIPANILFFTGNVIPAVVLTGALLLTDLFDGKLARKWNVVSKFGADLDAVCDKVMFLGMALPLLVINPIMILNILLEGAIAGVNILGRMKELDTKTVFAGKVKTVSLSLTLLVGYLVQFFNIPSIIFTILTYITCFSQGYALSEYIRKYKEMESNKKSNELLDLNDEEENSEKEYKEEKSVVDELKREREFVLATLEPDRVYTGKKRTRKMIQEQKKGN